MSVEQPTPEKPVGIHPPTRVSELVRLEIARMSIEAGDKLEEIIRRSCELSAKTLRVSRVGVWLFDESKSSLKCSCLFESDRANWSEGALIHVADFPNYFESLNNRKIVPAECAQTDPKTSELVESYLVPLGITSILDAPIFLGGEVIGVLCNEHTGPPREWTTEDRDLTASIADLLAMKIRAAEVRQLKKELKSQEERMLVMDKSDALASMSLGVAHDFRNLLTTISNCAYIVAKSTELPASLVEPVGLIAATVEKGKQLVSALVDFGRDEAKPYPLNIKKSIDDFLPVLRSAVGSKIRIHMDHSQTPGRVFMDGNQFDRILLNLVLNARDAMPDGGLVELRTYDDQRHGFVTIEVRDFGAGMDAESQSRIFEPFYSSKKHGTGLGMAVVKRIVDHTGGYILVESQLGKGTTVRIHLPRVSRKD